VLANALGEQLGHVAVEVGLDPAIALRDAAEGCLRMDIGVVVDLEERLQRYLQEPAVVQQGGVMVGNPPGSGVQIEALVELHVLGETAQLGVAIAAVERPVPASGTVVVFEHLDPVAGLAQLIGDAEAGEAGARHQDRRPLRIAGQFQGSVEAGLAGVGEGAHRLVHDGAAGRLADHGDQAAPAE
jgi:hypothetical protein